MRNAGLISVAVFMLVLTVAANAQSMLDTAENKMIADYDKTVGSIAGILFVCFQDKSILAKIDSFMKLVPPVYRQREETNFKAGIQLGIAQLFYDLNTGNSMRWECSDTRIQKYKSFIDGEMAKRGIE